MKIINEQQYKDEVLNSKGVVLLDFFATWCGPCRMIAPELEGLEEENNVKVVKVDVDEDPALAKEYGVLSIPTICIFKDGKYVDKFMGYKQQDEIEEIIKKYL